MVVSELQDGPGERTGHRGPLLAVWNARREEEAETVVLQDNRLR